ncbi:MAG: cyclopropane-fatty-acyl-phospholipid synthase [Smithellaceae bacterium]|nr:class I SAM-dependent methyltransferase [Syntrophaceae bacterium]MDD4240718.1 cyclopropane-fatty-acyl-phospholipid synthase [Smithellaceae bacterium]NLX52775.1 class I SAM-dependent methyltransferase [Deltaproteobacteria bacterium]
MKKERPSPQRSPRKSSPTIFERTCRNLVENLFNKIENGGLTLQLPDGTERRFGDPHAPLQARMAIADYGFFKDAVLGGDIGLGEAYMKGLWDTDDIPLLFTVLIRNRGKLANGHLTTAWLARQKDRVLHALRANTLPGSRKNIGEHYDLSNDFFETFLDPTMLYSCGLYESDSDTCEDAQRRKLQSIIRKAQLQPTDHVLEIGCGWGGFALEAARTTGCRVTGITVSEEQFALADERIRRAGLQDRISILLRDYRHMTGLFDKIVSIEMLEAVGHRYLGTFFQSCDRLLKPAGKLVIQVITIPDQSYENYRRTSDWIKKYIFPGGHLPSVTALSSAVTKNTSLLMEQLEDIGVHYARTLKDWRETFSHNVDKINALGFDEVFRRKWIYYLATCEAGFRERAIGDIQVVFRKPA